MPSYRDQILDDVFKVNLIIVPDDDDDAGSGFSFQEQEQVKVGPAATQQGVCVRVCVCDSIRNMGACACSLVFVWLSLPVW